MVGAGTMRVGRTSDRQGGRMSPNRFGPTPGDRGQASERPAAEVEALCAVAAGRIALSREARVAYGREDQ
jgi:hypothetical protein